MGLVKVHGWPLHDPESEHSPKFCTLARESALLATCSSDALDIGILRADSGCPQGSANAPRGCRWHLCHVWGWQ